ncbi:MAG: hypothetical protein AB8G15_11080 [Saprospiraceae bacterium]
MKNKQQATRFAAFTIAELVVVMALSLLVVAVALSAYQLINAQYFNYERDSKVILEVSTVKRLLYEEVQRAKTLYVADTGIRLAFEEFEIDYEFTDKAIIRKPLLAGVLVDSFFIEAHRWEARFEDNFVETGLIDYFELEISLHAQTEKLIFQKEYSASQLLRLVPREVPRK